MQLCHLLQLTFGNLFWGEKRPCADPSTHRTSALVERQQCRALWDILMPHAGPWRQLLSRLTLAMREGDGAGGRQKIARVVLRSFLKMDFHKLDKSSRISMLCRGFKPYN